MVTSVFSAMAGCSTVSSHPLLCMIFHKSSMYLRHPLNSSQTSALTYKAKLSSECEAEHLPQSFTNLSCE